MRSICGTAIPVLLVGLKKDLRDAAAATGRPFVTKAEVRFISLLLRRLSPVVGTGEPIADPLEQAEQVAQSIGARCYKECSALLNEGVDDIFEAATRAAMLVRTEGAASGHAGGEAKLEHRRKNSTEGKEDKGCGCVIL